MSYARGKNPKSWGNHKFGAESHRWSDQKIISSHGYVKLRVGTDHPLADPNGYAYEHLVVWVAAGNRRPAAGQTLHHKNDNKQDNRISNLELLTRSAHNSHHIKERGRRRNGQLAANGEAAGRTLDGRVHDEFPEVRS
jgi:hypothetical protein